MGLLCLIVSVFSGCATKGSNDLSATQIELLNELRSMSVEKEFDENVRSGHLVFYAYGGMSEYCYVPGLTAEEIARYIETKLVVVQIEFSAHPGPLGTSRQYWKEVAKFVEDYNRLVVQYLKKNGIPVRSGDLRGSVR